MVGNVLRTKKQHVIYRRSALPEAQVLLTLVIGRRVVDSYLIEHDGEEWTRSASVSFHFAGR